jgi:hypothetical protein
MSVFYQAGLVAEKKGTFMSCTVNAIVSWVTPGRHSLIIADTPLTLAGGTHRHKLLASSVIL